MKQYYIIKQRVTISNYMGIVNAYDNVLEELIYPTYESAYDRIVGIVNRKIRRNKYERIVQTRSCVKIQKLFSKNGVVCKKTRKYYITLVKMKN